MDISILKFDSNGLIPAIVVHHETNAVLMLGYMNDVAVKQTEETGLATFWSRSRQKLWVKGETSGQVMHVKWIRTDCDADGLLVGVDPVGPVCHDGYASCFYREWRGGQWEVCAERLMTPEELYGKKA
ncbi:phosphoribosyl-AMP cyclohydrolase [bacterium]|nr:phosphoribosyl-AMP cyclohydrolase [bacterium]